MSTEPDTLDIEKKEDEHPLEEELSPTEKPKRPVTKEKLRSIMEAASALTALGDEEEGEESSSAAQIQEKKEDSDEEGDDEESNQMKRYIPEHKKPDAALTFPEKLMNMMKFADKEDSKEYCIAWLPDGKSFVIRNPDEFTRNVLPKFFKATKFSSFTRKLYRWGFRQVNRGIGPDDPIIFGNEYFQRDSAELMVKMRSITAASTRKAQSLEAAQQEIEAQRNKRPLEMSMMDEQRKRLFLEQMLQQQKFGMPSGQDQPNFLQQASLQQSLNLASALRPSFGLQQTHHNQAFKHMNPPSFNQNPLGLYMPNQNSGGNNIQQPPPMPMQQSQPYNAASTAEIVNAAINALRFAS